MKKIQSKQIDIKDLSSTLKVTDKAPIKDPIFEGTVTVPDVNKENNKKAATVGYVDNRITELVGLGSGEVLDTGKLSRNHNGRV